MKRDRSLNDDEHIEFSVKRCHLKNQIILQDTKQEQSYSQIHSNHLYLFDKRNIIEKVQSWLDCIKSPKR